MGKYIQIQWTLQSHEIHKFTLKMKKCKKVILFLIDPAPLNTPFQYLSNFGETN